METIEASFFSGMGNWITNGVVFRIFLRLLSPMQIGF